MNAISSQEEVLLLLLLLLLDAVEISFSKRSKATFFASKRTTSWSDSRTVYTTSPSVTITSRNSSANAAIAGFRWFANGILETVGVSLSLLVLLV